MELVNAVDANGNPLTVTVTTDANNVYYTLAGVLVVELRGAQTVQTDANALGQFAMITTD